MTSPERVRVLSVLVEDGSSTLTKVAGMIRRRGFHVQAITVGPSGQAGRSRMTLQIHAGHAEVDQVRKQLERLVEVVEIEDLTEHDVHSRELVVARVRSVGGRRTRRDRRQGAANRVRSQRPSSSPARATRSATFVEELRRHGNLDVVRSGPVVMRRTA